MKTNPFHNFGARLSPEVEAQRRRVRKELDWNNNEIVAEGIRSGLRKLQRRRSKDNLEQQAEVA